MPPRPDRDLMPSELARLDEVRRVGNERVDELVATFVAAFADDPFFCFVSAGADEAIADALWGYSLRHLGRGIEVLATQTSNAVALWQPPAGSRTEIPAPSGAEIPSGSGYEDLLASYVGHVRADAAMAFFASVYKQRPPQPHWYLAGLAVDPASQNMGWGSRLLAPVLERCDADGVDAYLESSNPRNHSFYLRHGFRQVGSLGPVGGPELVCMLREPRQR